MAFIAFLVGIGALTGRRKMIIEIAIFISVYFCLFAWFRRGSGKMVVLTSLLGVVAYAAAVGMMAPDQGDESYASERVAKSERTRFSKYSERAQTVFQEVPKRVVDLGVMPVSWAIESSGWLGAGLGVGSQGAQHFGGQPNGAAEGGLGKLTVELGVPGLIVVFWMLVAFSRYVWHVLRMLSRTSPRHANLAFGLVAYILANVAAFSVATQAYGDLFVLLTLGWSFGFLVALPVLADAQLKPSMAVSKSVFDRVSHTEVAR